MNFIVAFTFVMNKIKFVGNDENEDKREEILFCSV